ncbi:hypothetical protein ASC85_30465 [Pseudomonas sp. Root401]|nr:hypothetical protein ASC85_30465 [Pseudomonas sp. Root401]
MGNRLALGRLFSRGSLVQVEINQPTQDEQQQGQTVDDKRGAKLGVVGYSRFVQAEKSLIQFDNGFFTVLEL